jgi:hypothetical protein
LSPLGSAGSNAKAGGEAMAKVSANARLTNLIFGKFKVYPLSYRAFWLWTAYDPPPSWGERVFDSEPGRSSAWRGRM